MEIFTSTNHSPFFKGKLLLGFLFTFFSLTATILELNAQCQLDINDNFTLTCTDIVGEWNALVANNFGTASFDVSTGEQCTEQWTLGPLFNLETFDVSTPQDWSCGDFFSLEFQLTGTDPASFGFGLISVTISGSVVEFDQSAYTVAESDASVDICLSLSETPTALVTVQLEIEAGSTAQATDYSGLTSPHSVVFPAGATGPSCIAVAITQDGIVESDENIVVSISSTDNNFYPGSTSTTTITVLDSDDNDGDGIANLSDNCPEDSNPLQEDLDNDGIGDVCDSANTLPPLAIIDSDLFLSSTFSGVVVRSPDNNCWRMFVNNNGQIQTTAVVCPPN